MGSRQVLGMNWRDRELIAELNPRRHHNLADDKILGKKLLAAAGVPVPRTIAVVEDTRGVAHAVRIVGGLEHFVVKPARGRAGSGIAVLGPRVRDGWCGSSGIVWDEGDIRRLLVDILSGEYAMRTWDRALIEERILAGPVLGDLPVIGLPDIRVITVHGVPVMSMVRFPTSRSAGKANLHLGAIGIGIDMGTGMTIAATCRGRVLTHHPESGRRLSGLKVAAWTEVIETARKAAGAFPLAYLGIDIVMTHEGLPVVLEVNTRPGLEIQNANLRGLRPGIARVLARMEEPGRSRDAVT